MAFEGLTEKISATFKKLRGKGRLKESDVKEAMREIRMALLEADVSYKVVKDFTKSVTERCVGTDVLESLTPAQMIVKIVNEELTRLMGSDAKHININPNGPTSITTVGPLGLILICFASLPMSRVSSSLTILTIIWAGVRDSRTSLPTQRSVTCLVKSLQTL